MGNNTSKIIVAGGGLLIAGAVTGGLIYNETQLIQEQKKKDLLEAEIQNANDSHFLDIVGQEMATEVQLLRGLYKKYQRDNILLDETFF